jgi:hypothetical protein
MKTTLDPDGDGEQYCDIKPLLGKGCEVSDCAASRCRNCCRQAISAAATFTALEELGSSFLCGPCHKVIRGQFYCTEVVNYTLVLSSEKGTHIKNQKLSDSNKYLVMSFGSDITLIFLIQV